MYGNVKRTCTIFTFNGNRPDSSKASGYSKTGVFCQILTRHSPERFRVQALFGYPKPTRLLCEKNEIRPKLKSPTRHSPIAQLKLHENEKQANTIKIRAYYLKYSLKSPSNNPVKSQIQRTIKTSSDKW